VQHLPSSQEGEYMYYLDFATVIQLLKEFRRSGALQAELPKGIMNTQEPCWIQLKLLQGEITDCQIIAGSGETTVADKNLLHRIEGLGPLEWTFEPLKGSSTSLIHAPADKSTPTSSIHAPTDEPSPVYLSVPTSPSPPKPSASSNQFSLFFSALVPRRLTTIEKHLLNALTRQQRRVLALVDGRRNIVQIAALLFGSANIESGAEEVLALLQEMEALKIIALR
jgi:hypothetical protein